jgi:hypothetical protein
MPDLAPRVPSAYEQEQIVSSFQQLADRLLSDPELIHDEDVLACALAVQNDAGAMLDGLIRAAMWADRRVVEADAERKSWSARKSRYEARLEAIRDTIARVMVAIGAKRHRGVERMATLVEREAQTVKFDVDALPDEYVEIETKMITVRHPRRDLIMEDIAQGVVIEGVTISNNPPYLRLA